MTPTSAAISKMFSGDYTPNFVQVLLIFHTLNLPYEKAFPADWYQTVTSDSQPTNEIPPPQVVQPPDVEYENNRAPLRQK